ncbi:uncharacterized protein LOC135481083 [Liolophura sinensis]|uniref:uncharacterized protein LOC135481083 n=1 Tax=Liolophura sinensis TaxID=3198878 RepID=UPI0031580B1F
MFVAEDGDHDGQLSIAESVAAFRRYDANGDSKISRTEYACFQRDLHPGLGDFAHALYDEYRIQMEMTSWMIMTSGHSMGKMDLDGNFQVGQVEFVTFWEKIFKKYEHYHVNGAHHPANTHACAHGN